MIELETFHAPPPGMIEAEFPLCIHEAEFPVHFHSNQLNQNAHARPLGLNVFRISMDVHWD